MSQTDNIKPLPLGKSFLYLFLPAAMLYITHYYLVPSYVERSGVPYFKGYLLGYILTMGFFLVAALVAFRLEGRTLTWTAIKTRFRLRKMKGLDWMWTVGIIVFVLVTYFGLGFTGAWVESVPFLASRAAWPPEFGPGGTSHATYGEFMGMQLAGQWWLVLLYFTGWFFNIVGEEFWFRGYILPRQELAFGKAAWLANGLMFTLNHIWQPWILIAILPASMLLAYAVQSRQNTWIGLLQHGFVNSGLLVFLILGVVN